MLANLKVKKAIKVAAFVLSLLLTLVLKVLQFWKRWLWKCLLYSRDQKHDFKLAQFFLCFV